MLPQKTATLERRRRRLLSEVDARADHAWCGSCGTSATGTPSIGAVPGMAQCCAVLGVGGNGIRFSAMASPMIRTEVLGSFATR